MVYGSFIDMLKEQKEKFRKAINEKNENELLRLYDYACYKWLESKNFCLAYEEVLKEKGIDIKDKKVLEIWLKNQLLSMQKDIHKIEAEKIFEESYADKEESESEFDNSSNRYVS